MGISLEKRVETVTLSLKKMDVKADLAVDVAFCIDISGSMSYYFSSGTVQDVIDRIFAMAFTIDPDKQLEVFKFNNGSAHCPKMIESDYGTYVNKKLGGIGGGTSYAPVLRDVYNTYAAANPVEKLKTGLLGMFNKKYDAPVKKPVYVIFITDGDCDDAEKTKDIINTLGSTNIYIQCVGIGSGFRLLKQMADQYDHVGFCEMNNLNMSDEAMYDLFFTAEFKTWISKF